MHLHGNQAGLGLGDLHGRGVAGDTKRDVGGREVETRENLVRGRGRRGRFRVRVKVRGRVRVRVGVRVRVRVRVRIRVRVRVRVRLVHLVEEHDPTPTTSHLPPHP